MTGQGDGRKVLWFSCAPWALSGYGTQTATMVPRLAELGYDVAIAAFFGLDGQCRTWTSGDRTFLVYPGSPFDGHANDVWPSHAKHWFAGAEDGIVFSLTDPWVMWPRNCARLPLAAWTPVDHDPLMELTANWYKESDAIPVAMSRFGERVMRDAGLDPLYVPHGVDSSTFHLLDRAQARERSGFPRDAFVVGIVAANKGVPSRKGFAQMLAAYRIFEQRHPGESLLYLHTHVRQPDGEDLVMMCERTGVKPRIVHQYYYALGIDAASLADVISSFDILLNLSHGEGFGIPIVEAMACGVPAIVTDFSSMPEIVGDTGWLVSGQPEWTAFNSFQVCPDIEEAAEALERAYSEPASDRELRQKQCLDRADEYESANVAARYLAPAMVEVSDRIDWKRARRQIRDRAASA